MHMGVWYIWRKTIGMYVHKYPHILSSLCYVHGNQLTKHNMPMQGFFLKDMAAKRGNVKVRVRTLFDFEH